MLTTLLGLLLLLQAPSDPTEDDPTTADTAQEQASPRYGISADFDWSFSNSETSPLNATYYGDNILRLLRVSLLFNFRPSERVGLYVNLTSENGGTPHLYGAFVRLAPFEDTSFWIQAGKIPQAFGAFPERWYPFANSLIGYPLMYSYLTSLQPNSVPAGPDDLLSQRGRGLSSQFRGGYGDADYAGMPLVEIFQWAAGGLGYGSAGSFEYLGGVTAGTLSNPLQVDENGGTQVLGRVRFRPSPALNAGASAARGAYLVDLAEEQLGGRSPDAFHQTAVGGDFHYGRGHLLLYGEMGWSRWESPHIDEPLDAVSAFLESRYRLLPGVYAAGRLDRLSFSDITARNGSRQPWEYPLTRLEVGSGFSWERHVLLKLVGQFNWYDQATDLDENIIAFQMVLHF